jgi:O-antigen/teichoic acid export membrane protein
MIYSCGKNKMSGLILLSGLVLKLVSVYPLTVLYGLNGSALSSLISLLLVLIFTVYTVENYLDNYLTFSFGSPF